MNKTIAIAARTAGIFAAGVLTGIGLQHLRPLPPPPMPPLGEFAEFGEGAEGLARLEARLAELPVKTQVFSAQLREIERRFHNRLLSVLTPAQARRLEAIAPPHATDAQPPTHRDDPRMALAGLGFFTILGPQQDFLESELDLDAAQKQELLRLLNDRRTEFLQLIDTSPPPSIGIYLPPPASR
jgi:hypothetical protein